MRITNTAIGINLITLFFSSEIELMKLNEKDLERQLDDFNQNVSKVTTAQIKDAFSRRVNPEKMVTVVVGGAE
jgi:predicted Zn-dependent peptidase